MSANQAKEDNLVQLKQNDDNSDNIRLNNKINILEKQINDIADNQKDSSTNFKRQLNNSTEQHHLLENSVNATLEKLNNVDKEISQLYKDIDNTNLSISTNVQKIESDQTELSTKVSETYKQLGSVEKSYSALKTKSSKITKEIKTITSQVENISDEIREKIITIESNSTNLNNKVDNIENQTQQEIKLLKEGHETLIEKTNSIVKDAKITATALENSINENATLMANIEAKLITEIETLAQNTDTKTTTLEKSIDGANEEIKAHSAKMLKLQSVDDALEKRASKLELTAKTLSEETLTLFKVSETLEQRSSALEDTVETLGIQIYRIEQENEIQQAQLDLLREKSKETNKTVAALSQLVSFNFVTTGLFLTALVIAVVGLYVYQDNLWTVDTNKTVERNTNIDQKIAGLTNHVKTTDSQAADRIAQLETQIVALNKELQSVNDKNISLDNRLINIAPHRKIGNDNILHSQQWIAQQSNNNSTIQVLTASSEEEVFELAVRYNYHLTDVLSYKIIQNEGELNYVLYMGNYADKVTAQTALNDLPFRLNGQTPELTTFAHIK